MVLDPAQARSRQRLDDALDVVAHHPDVRVCGWVAEAVVVQVGDDLLNTGFLGEALGELGRELGLAEDRLDLGGFHRPDKLRQLAGRWLLTWRRCDDADELEA